MVHHVICIQCMIDFAPAGPLSAVTQHKLGSTWLGYVSITYSMSTKVSATCYGAGTPYRLKPLLPFSMRTILISCMTRYHLGSASQKTCEASISGEHPCTSGCANKNLARSAGRGRANILDKHCEPQSTSQSQSEFWCRCLLSLSSNHKMCAVDRLVGFCPVLKL